MIRMVRNWLRSRRLRRQLEQMAPRPFVDTPQAWADRRVIPGETREQARARLEKHRRTDG
jgi:hypothetical protein